MKASARISADALTESHASLLHSFRMEAQKIIHDNPEAGAASLIERLLPELISLVPETAFELVDPAKRGIVLLHGDIEKDEVVPLQEHLLSIHLSLAKRAPLLLNVSSYGGDMDTGIALVSTINEIRRAGRRVHIHVQSSAQSMASALVQAADYRTIEPNAYFMLHKSWWATPAMNFDEHTDYLKECKRQLDTFFGLYAARTGKPISYYHKTLYKKDWYMSAQEALAEGLVDKIVPVPAFPQA